MTAKAEETPTERDCGPRRRSGKHVDELTTTDVHLAFERLGDSYFNVRTEECPRCGAVYLSGYYEDFSNLPIEAEWGERHWYGGYITRRQFARILKAVGTQSLKLEDFVGER